MATTKKVIPISKKEWNERIQKALEGSLAELKILIGERKFEKKLKKAGRILTPGRKYRLKTISLTKTGSKGK